MERIADFILNNRRPILWVAVILTIAAIYPALNMKADFSLEGFFPENDPTIDAYQRFSEEYGRDDNSIIIGMESDALFTPQKLQQIRSIADSLTLISNVSGITTIWDAQYLTSRDGNLESRFYLDGNLGYANLDSLKQEMIRDPFVERLILNQEGNFTAVILNIDEENNSFPVRQQVIRDLQSHLEPHLTEFDVHIAGIPYFRNQYVVLLNQEIIFYISISSVLIIMLLWFLFRNAQGVLIPIFIVWLTILFTVAVLYLTGGYFEVLTSTIAPILLCVGVADSIHMLSKYNDGMMVGMPRKIALRDSLIVLGSATFLTSVTTAIGFATLLTSNVIPMRTFGLYTAIGVMIAFVITIFLLPSALPLFKHHNPRVGRSGRFQEFTGNLLRGTFYIAYKYHKPIVISTILVTIGIGTGISQLKVNGFVFDDVGQDSALVESSNIISNNLAPQFPLEIIIDTGEENGITDPELLQRVNALQNWLLEYDEMEKSLSFVTLLSEVHRVMNPEDHAQNPLPTDRQLISQYLLLMEISGAEGLDLITDFSYSQIRISTQAYDKGSFRLNQIRESLDIYLNEHFPENNINITGTTILVADLTDNIVYSLAASILLAFFFISLIMARLFKNYKLVIISLLPNIMPLVIIAGVMGYFGVDIKPSTAVIFTIAFGIAVDDSIHFLARFRIETRRGKSLFEATRITTEKTGRAILLTSIILVMGFGTLGFSDFDSTMLMGRLVCLTIIIAVIADLLFLPALLHWIKPDLESVRNAELSSPKSADESHPEPLLHQV